MYCKQVVDVFDYIISLSLPVISQIIIALRIFMIHATRNYYYSIHRYFGVYLHLTIQIDARNSAISFSVVCYLHIFIVTPPSQ